MLISNHLNLRYNLCQALYCFCFKVVHTPFFGDNTVYIPANRSTPVTGESRESNWPKITNWNKNKKLLKFGWNKNTMETLLHQSSPPLKNSTPSSHSNKEFHMHVESSNEQETTLLDPIEWNAKMVWFEKYCCCLYPHWRNIVACRIFSRSIILGPPNSLSSIFNLKLL